MSELPPDITNLQDQLDEAERDARSLVANLAEERGRWRAEESSWSVAQCLDHLAITNGVYLGAMHEPAAKARAKGRLRQQPALPGLVGRWFAKKMEPPVQAGSRMKTMRKIKPGESPSLEDAFTRFLRSQQEIQRFLTANADLDLAEIRFPNPLIPGIRFSLATGLHIMLAHERRHLWQAWKVRDAAEKADGGVVLP